MSNKQKYSPGRQYATGSHAHHQRAAKSNSGLTIRVVAFVAVVLLVIAGAVLLVLPTSGGASSTVNVDYTVQVTMAGFQPASISIPAGKPATIKLVNTDSPYHTDGGGVHQFASPELGLDFKVDPKSSKVITIPATKAGTYSFYCDVCCGGKENPTMQGKLVVA